MAFILIPVLCVLSVALGGVLGVVPFLDMLLRLNLWFVIPVGGLLLGMLIALVTFYPLFKFHIKLTTPLLLLFGLTASAAYLASDYAAYATYDFQEEGKTIHLKDVATFEQYMEMRLSKTEVTHHGTTPLFEVGGIGTKIFYLIDLIGAFVGAAGILLVFKERYPFCARCAKYLRVTYKKTVRLLEEGLFKTSFDGLVKSVGDSNGDEIRNFFTGAADDKKGGFLIFFESRGCPSCARGHVLLRPSVKQKNNWVEMKTWTVRKDLESPLIRSSLI